MKFKFKFDFRKSHENFADYFDIAWDKSKKHKFYALHQLLYSKRKPIRNTRNAIFATIGKEFFYYQISQENIVVGVGFLMLPGGKLSIQRTLKSFYVSAGTELLDSSKLYLN